jgi:hypothetical protein
MLSERQMLGRKRRTIEFIGTGSSDYCDFITNQPQVLPLMLQWLVENDHLWDLLHLSDISDASTLVQVLPEFFSKHSIRRICGCFVSAQPTFSVTQLQIKNSPRGKVCSVILISFAARTAGVQTL